MVLKGKWKSDKKQKQYKSVAFHLSGLYSPWRTFGQFARKFLEVKKYPERLQNFVNSWLAEPWRDDSSRLKQEEAIEALKGHILYQRGIVPSEAVALTAGVDVQEDRFYFVLRAWASDYTSWLVLEGEVQEWEMLEKILFANRYPVSDGSQMAVELVCIDSGYRTKEVYKFVAAHYPRIIAVKGASSDMRGRPYALPSPEAKKQLGVAAPYLINVNFFKDFIHMRQRIPPCESGAWYIYEGVSEDYLKQITSEVRVQRKGKVYWVKRSEHAANHLWDAEVYAAVAAEILNVSYRQHRQTQQVIIPKRPQNKQSWVPRRSGWLR
jgi:phage terminase large subunit GpA-like protein